MFIAYLRVSIIEIYKWFSIWEQLILHRLYYYNLKIYKKYGGDEITQVGTTIKNDFIRSKSYGTLYKVMWVHRNMLIDKLRRLDL